MSVKDIAKLGELLAHFLAGFACCFARPEGRALLAVYVRGLLSDVQRKNVEAIALDQKVAPRTLQRFLESIVWDEEKLRDRCQRIIASEHVSPGLLLTMEKVRRAAKVFIESIGLPPRCRERLYRDEVHRQDYYSRRSAQAAKSHRKTRHKRLAELGLDPNCIKSITPKPSEC